MSEKKTLGSHYIKDRTVGHYRLLSNTLSLWKGRSVKGAIIVSSVVGQAEVILMLSGRA